MRAMRLHGIFRGYARGDECTGAIALYGLQASRLVRLGVVKERPAGYYFRGLPGSAAAMSRDDESRGG